MGWRDMSIGIKIVFIYFIILMVSAFTGFFTDMPATILIFIVSHPASLLVSVLFLFMPLICAVAVYLGRWWKPVLVVQGFMVFDIICSIALFFMLPVAALNEKMGLEVGSANIQAIADAGLMGRIIISAPFIFYLIVYLVVWVYLFKRKDHFSEQKPSYNLDN
ncbi:MAG: hypothetical protein R6U32_03850 [Candidatus Woesearchaeota archaeon]